MTHIIKDKDGDFLELEELDDGVYVTIDQGGVLATVGPFPKELIHV